MRRMLLWATAVAGCVPAGREGVELPVALYAADPGPFQYDRVQLTIERATITTADLLLRDADDVLTGAWAGQRAANLLGLPGPHGTVLFYEGTAARASFEIDGAPAISLTGEVNGTRPFSVDVTADVVVEPVVATLEISADEPPARIDWIVDLSVALGDIDWLTTDLDDGAELDDALLDGFSNPAAWRLEAVR